MSRYMELPQVRAREVRRGELLDEAHRHRLAGQASHGTLEGYGRKGLQAILSGIVHHVMQIRDCERFTPGVTMLVRKAALLLEG